MNASASITALTPYPLRTSFLISSARNLTSMLNVPFALQIEHLISHISRSPMGYGTLNAIADKGRRLAGVGFRDELRRIRSMTST
jgi:hypothetical protein